MRLQYALRQVQTVKMNIAPQIQQGIHMLQLSADELFDYLQELYTGCIY